MLKRQMNAENERAGKPRKPVDPEEEDSDYEQHDSGDDDAPPTKKRKLD
jgi:hypothetical protein